MTEGVKVKNKLYVHIPTYIVRNEDIYLSNDEFVFYARLCFLYFREYQEKEIVVNHQKLRSFLKIADTRTFKKRLQRLYKVGLVENEIKNLPTKGTLTIVFNEEAYKKGDHFTRLSAEVFSYWLNEQIHEYAFRQLFYYTSHINLNDEDKTKWYCFVGFETLTKRLKISRSSVESANKQLEEAKLVKVKVGQLQNTNTYNDCDELIFHRPNNEYHVANKLH
jgi:predicted transcriptional regulator